MKQRKTIEIAKLRAYANAFLANSADEQSEQRIGVHGLVAGLLMDADAYCGFRYLGKADVLPGKTFGITHGSPPVFHDETRTHLF